MTKTELLKSKFSIYEWKLGNEKKCWKKNENWDKKIKMLKKENWNKK